MANIFESAFMTLKNGMTMYFADSKARQWLQKLQEALAKKYGPDNPPPATEGGRIWYATCSTPSGTGAKTATTSTGDFALATGSMVRILFTTSNTAANPTISIDGSTAKAIRPISSASGMANKIAAGEVIDLVYDGSNFVMTKGNAATTSFYGITKLNSSTNSTSTSEAATPSAVKDVADAKVDRAGDTMTGELNIEKASGDVYCYAKRTDTSVRAGMGVGSGGANHGVYSFGYNDGSYHSDGKWMLYRDYSGDVIVNGKATDNVLKSGDTMTGNLLVKKAGGAYVRAESSTTGEVLALAANISANHGIYSYGYYDGSSFQNVAKWMIYRDNAGDVIVNGRATDNVLKSGDTMTGNLAVEKASEVNIWASNTKSGQTHKISLCAGGSGRGGIYDSTHGKWLVDYTLSGDLELGGVFFNKTETLTITRTENVLVTATAVGRLHAYKKNGMLFLNGNLLVSAGAIATAFTEIASIAGWSAADSCFLCVPKQGGTGSDPIMTFYITAAGKIQVYAPNTISTESWYRFAVSVPTSD